MITHVDTVLIGKQIASSLSDVNALAAGDVALFDQNRKLIDFTSDFEAAAAATSLYIGVAKDKVNVTKPDGSVEQKANIKFGNEIKKDSKPNLVFGEYVAPVKEKVEIDLASATIVAGNRYVIRIVYKDIYEAAWQFTHTYEVYAESATASELATAFEKKINAHKNRRITVSVSDSKITLTAMEKDDNEGVYSINEYSVVSMEVSLYATKPGALLSNYPASVPGATITKTVGNPGKGYWKQVRDQEVRNMGYTGHVFTGAYPIVEQDRMVEKDATYDYVTIENDNKYLSNDNQYIKTTPLVTELYVKHSASFNTSNFIKAIKAFITGNATQE